MKSKTKAQYKKLLVAMALAYAVDTVAGEKFEVSEPIQTKLNDKVQASSAFLQMISLLPVDEMAGQALELAVDGIIGSRTDTSTTGERSGTELGAPNGSTWTASQTDYDVFIKYKTLDAWASLGNLHTRYMAMVYKAIALTRITIGWHGTSVAATTNKTNNPLGQDVNKGWLQILRDQAAARIIGEGNYETSGKVFIGKNSNNPDYQNLDAAVNDLYQMIAIEHRTGSEVVIVGSALVAADINKTLTEHAGTPSEKVLGITTLAKSYGGLTAIQVPGFPATGLVVTDLKNLHLYYQNGSARRMTQDEPKKNRVNDWISSNEAYAIGDMMAIAAFEPTAVTIVDESTAAATFGA